jgi:hypothetical protein
MAPYPVSTSIEQWRHRCVHASIAAMCDFYGLRGAVEELTSKQIISCIRRRNHRNSRRIGPGKTKPIEKLVFDQLWNVAYPSAILNPALLPSVSLFPVALRLINWRALSMTLFFMLLVSLLWEATAAVPKGIPPLK